MPAVELQHITKTYQKGALTAVNDVSFSVNEGELFGLIGPDGAGKTTIFRLLTTLLLPDSGTAAVNGFDVIRDYEKIRSCVGYMPGKFSLYQDLTVEENLQFFATVFDTTIEENYELIRDIYTQIEPFKHRRAGKLSGGMKQKLALSCALIHKPAVLFLDEPTTGVDAVSRKEFWEMLKRLQKQGITILVSTPYMDEAVLCDRIALMQAGSILSLDTPDEIVAAYAGKLFAARSAHQHRLLRELRDFPAVKDCYSFGENLHLTLHDDSNAGQQVIRQFIDEHGHTDVSFSEILPTIEDCFIKLLTSTHHAG